MMKSLLYDKRKHLDCLVDSFKRSSVNQMVGPDIEFF